MVLDDMGIQLIGYVAATLTTFAFVPQTIKVIQSNDTKSLSLWMYLIFTAGVLLWLLYGIVKDDLPLIFANTITASLALVILYKKIRNGD